MTEIAITQRSQEWYDLRRSVALTASKFGDAIGVGIGKPFDFLQSLLYTTQDSARESSPYTQHGVDMEPIIREAYELLSRHKTEETGFWFPRDTDLLYQQIGASPDVKVIGESGSVIGLAEFKAPVFSMYSEGPNVPHGIPRCYMAQIQVNFFFILRPLESCHS